MFTASGLLALGLWWFLALLNPLIVPNPPQVLQSAVNLFKQGALVDDVLSSVIRVVSGFVLGSIAGIVVGFALGWYRPIRELLDPWIQFLRMIPPLALLPVIIIYLGIGEPAKVAVIFFSVFLTVVIAAFEGIVSARPLLVKVARMMGASDRQLFLSVILPGSVPHILIGLRLGLASGWTTVVAAEIIAASAGLGYLVEISGTEFDMASAYLSLVLIGSIGLAMDYALQMISRRVAPWQDRTAR